MHAAGRGCQGDCEPPHQGGLGCAEVEPEWGLGGGGADWVRAVGVATRAAVEAGSFGEVSGWMEFCEGSKGFVRLFKVMFEGFKGKTVKKEPIFLKSRFQPLVS